MTRFAFDLTDFPDLLAATAQFKNLPDSLIEKDYFVVRALRALQMEIGSQFIFKGGTSLSKGWELLDRFSEDIDLLFRTTGGNNTPISRGEIDRRLEHAEEVVVKTPGFTFIEQTRSRGIRRCSDFSYPSRSQTLLPISSTIRLEMGTRGGVQPSARRAIRSYVTEFAQTHGHSGLAEDLQPFDMECLDVTRTTVEKLFAAHAAFSRDRAANRTRHYYDLYKLTGLADVREFLGSKEYRAVFEDVEQHCRQNWPDAALPARGKFRESPAFQPDTEQLAELKRNYEAERELFFTQPPSMEEILVRLASAIEKI